VHTLALAEQCSRYKIAVCTIRKKFMIKLLPNENIAITTASCFHEKLAKPV